MATEVKAPNPISTDLDTITVFVGGSIEEGKAVDWQAELVKSLSDINGVQLLNPRREEWDASWPNTADFAPFREQVEWELNGIENSDLVVFYIDPKTKSVISLLEIGLTATSKNILVCCPKGYFRRGNIEIVCERYGVPMYETMEELEEQLRIEILELQAG